MTVPAPPLTGEDRAMEQLLVSHFDGHDLSLPPMPRVAERVLHRLRQSSFNMREVADDLADDPVIAGDVLRVANSALYRGQNKITTLQAAVTRLGAHTLRTLMMHQSMRSAMFQKKGADRRLGELIWHRSLASGCSMRTLARFTGMDQDDAFLLGLLHDIGNVVVLRMISEQQAFTHRLFRDDVFEYFCQLCHQEFGELIAESWKLTADLTSLISNHHEAPADDDPLATSRWMLILTDMINQMLGYAPIAEYNLLDTEAARALGLPGKPGFESALAALPDEIEEVLDTLS